MERNGFLNGINGLFGKLAGSYVAYLFLFVIMFSPSVSAAGGMGVDKAMYRLQSNIWTTGNAGQTVEGKWISYQYVIKNIDPNEPLPNFTITFPIFVDGNDAIYFDGLSNFRYCIDDGVNACAAQGGGTPGSLPDGTSRPPASTATGWLPFVPQNINKAYGACTDPSDPVPTGTVGVTAPCELHSFKVVPGTGSVPSDIGTRSRITFFFELHLAQTPLWIYALEKNMETGEANQILPDFNANPNNVNYGFQLYNTWNNAFPGSGPASVGSSQHVNIVDFQLRGTQGISQGQLTLPIPTVQTVLASIISGMKFQDTNGNGIKDVGEIGLGNWTITLAGILNGGGAVSFPVVTNASGSYVFNNIYGGEYTLSETQKVDFTQTAPTNTPAGQLPNGSPLPSGVTRSGGTYLLNLSGTVAQNPSNLDFGNQPPYAYLTVIKHVINDNQGTAVASDFIMHVTGNSPTPANFPGSESGTVVQLLPGVYNVSEDIVLTYTGNYSADCSGTITAGQNKTCIVTNDDPVPAPKPPVLIVIKHVINDNGGTKTATDFTINVTAADPSPSSFSGEESPGVNVTLGEGAYSVAENSVYGYAVSYSADCSGTIANDEVKTCIVTNDDIQPQLTLVKTVINDNGGNKVVSDFPLFVDATSVVSGATNGFDAGSYTASETTQSGYAASSWGGDCAADGSVTLSVGDSKTCTITNNDIPPYLTLIKNVVNDNGGTKVVADFPLFIDGTPTTSGTPVMVTANAIHTASETTQTGYSASVWGTDCAADGTVTLLPGQNKTCTITNNDVSPKLKLIKTVINNNGGAKLVSDFPLFISGTPATSGTSYDQLANTLLTATETTQTGYSASVWGGDCAADGTITLLPGDDKTCTITNDDIAPKLTLIKTVINDNGGNKVVADFPLFVDATGVVSGVANEFMANVQLTASETTQTGYAPSVWGGDCAADGTITLLPGDDKTCTITNDDIPPYLTLIKNVVNDNGGNKVVADFPLFIDGNPTTSGTPVMVTSNAVHTSSETTQTGYSASVWGTDCAADGTVTLLPGQNKTCTITNDDVAPKLTLIKTVVNDNGGNKVVSDFPLFVDATSVVSGVANEFTANVQLTASETTQTGYSASVWGGDCAADGTITLLPGDDKTCTITNDDIAPNLRLVKTVINDNGGTLTANDFPAFINSDAASWNVFYPVSANTQHTASETAQFGYAASVWGGDCAADGSVSLLPGENKTCTITNDDIQPMLYVFKNVINDNGGNKVASDFAISVVANNPSPANFAGSETGTLVMLDAGAYSVDETNDPQYAKFRYSECEDFISVGEVKNCTIENDDRPASLTLIKRVINDNGGNKVVSDFPLFVGNTSVVSGESNEFMANTLLTATETTQTGYSASVWGGDCAADGTITLLPGDDKTCTITNDDIAPKLTLIKTVINNNGGNKVVSDFPLFVDATSVVSGVANEFMANVQLTASETTQTGYTPSVWGGDCAADGTITLLPGDEKTCTITNDDIAPKLTLIKNVVNDNGGNKVVADFPLFVDATGVVSGVANEFMANVQLTASETTQTGYAASSWTGDCAADGTITLLPGDEKTCTITNDDIPPYLTLVKRVINDNGGTLLVSDFPLFIDGNPTTSGTPVMVTANAQHTASETTQTGYAPSDWSIDCAADGTVTLLPGQNKTCLIYNDDIAPKLTLVKRVINDNGGNKVVSDFPLFVDATGVVSGVANEFMANVQLTASETTQTGYAPSVWGGDCAADGTITLLPGDDKTCTISNDDIAPKLTLIKTVVNDNGGDKVVADFALFISGTPATSGTAYEQTANTQLTSTETNLPGYAPSVWSGDCAADGTITLLPGDDKTCTISNDDIPPYLTLIKNVVNDNGGNKVVADFPLFIDGNPTTSGTPVMVTANAQHTSSETTQTGYSASVWGTDCAADGTVTLLPGQNKTCTITNDDIAPKLTLVKRVINDNGGTLEVSDFPLFIDGTSATSSVAYEVTANAVHTATETTQSGYAPSVWGGDCAADGTITLLPGDEKICVIYNDDIPPYLTLVKRVINDNGGTKDVADFPLFIDGNPTTSGTPVMVTANAQHTASETTQTGYAPSDWSIDCAADGTVTLLPGQNKTCLIYNDDIAPKLTLIKNVVNDNGGNKVVSDFPLFVDATSVVSGVANEFMANVQLTASETTQTGYAASSWTGDCAADGTITLLPGDEKTCTITNDDIAPKLTLIKNVVSDNGGSLVVSDFPLFVDATGVVSGVANEFMANVQLTASETTQTGYAASVWGGDCAADGTITLLPGDDKTCTITNDDIPPYLTLVKRVINDNGGTLLVSDFPLFIDGNPTTSGTPVMVTANAVHTATETQQAGYNASIWGTDCAADGTVTLLPGQNKTCTITNDDIQPRLVVFKHVINDNGGTALPEDFTLYVNGTNPTPSIFPGFDGGQIVMLDAGAYSADELDYFGYAKNLSIDCSGTIAIGETKLCVIINDDIAPILTLVKTVINDNGGTKVVSDFPLFVSGSPVTSGVPNAYAAGAYVASETQQAGYAASNWTGDCAFDGSILLSIGENKTCYITNDDIQPRLIVIKRVINDNGGNKTASDFQIYVNASGATPSAFNGSETGIEVLLNAGSYAVLEGAHPGYKVNYSIDCTGSIAPGEVKTCIITNDDVRPTRTIGFWQTHTYFTTKIFMNYSGGIINIGSPIRKVVNDTGKLFGGFYASIPYKTTGVKRTNLEKARIQMLQQLLATKLNCAAFGCDASTIALIASADAAYSGTNTGLIGTLSSQLDAYNNGGDSAPIPYSLGSWGSATPDLSKAIANKVFWDTP